MRKLFDFHGGIHPAEHKHLSLDGPVTEAGIPPELVLPLAQHIGAAAEPVVAVGDRVLKGQLLAEANGFVSVPLHAPSSGTVTAIEERLIAHPSGHTATCIVLATDGRDEWTTLEPTADYRALEPDALRQRIRNAGIAGMGGAGFPTAVKLSPRPGSQVQTLIINGTECEPYITADDVLMREQAAELMAGVQILRHLLQPAQTLIGVEDNKPEAIAALRAALPAAPGAEIVVFPTKYPSGGEKQLIEILTGKQVPSGGLPLDVGVICQNVGSVAAIHDAVIHGRPLISRITTVTGEAVQHPGNFRPVGHPDELPACQDGLPDGKEPAPDHGWPHDGVCRARCQRTHRQDHQLPAGAHRGRVADTATGPGLHPLWTLRASLPGEPAATATVLVRARQGIRQTGTA